MSLIADDAHIIDIALEQTAEEIYEVPILSKWNYGAPCKSNIVFTKVSLSDFDALREHQTLDQRAQMTRLSFEVSSRPFPSTSSLHRAR